MRRAWSILMLAACQGGGDDGYPIVPGGDDSPITPMVDAAVPGTDATDDAMSILSGRVCLIADLRNPTLPACSGTNAGGLTVTLDGQTATTSPDGGFAISVPAGTNLAWRVSGAGVVSSVMPLGEVHVLPVVSEVTYEELLLANGVILQPAQGSIVVRVVGQGQPVVGARASSSPPVTYDTFYDGPTASTWNLGATGAFGAIWLVGAPTGTALVSVVPPGTAPTVVTALPVDDQAITFATVEIP